MADKDLLMKRLSTIKLLYKMGMDQSFQNENISFFSVLAFHDSIEMFLTLAAEDKGIKSEKFSFLDYWVHMPQLTMKESMRTLNTRRVNLKHKGLIPSKRDIEISRVHTTDFFEQNTKAIFGIEFSEVSLYELMTFPQAKRLVILANDCLSNNDIEGCIKNITISFYQLISEYKENKKYHNGYRTHFDFIETIRFNRHDTGWSENKEVSKQMERIIDSTNKNFEKIQNALGLISMGIDYRKYSKFLILTPAYHRTAGGHSLQSLGQKNWNKENCQFLLDFVLECALILQEFDYDNKSLIGSEAFLLNVFKPSGQ